MAQDYTQRQGQYLAFIHYYTRLHGIPPAEADIQSFVGVSGPAVTNLSISAICPMSNRQEALSLSHSVWRIHCPRSFFNNGTRRNADLRRNKNPSPMSKSGGPTNGSGNGVGSIDLRSCWTRRKADLSGLKMNGLHLRWWKAYTTGMVRFTTWMLTASCPIMFIQSLPR